MRTVARFLLAAFVITSGIMHFATPAFFIAIVPAYLPSPRALVAISGVCEIAGGIGILVPATRRLAGIGLMLLFAAVFPANVNMAVHHLPLAGQQVAPALLWGRLFLQPLFILWAWWCAVRTRAMA